MFLLSEQFESGIKVAPFFFLSFFGLCVRVRESDSFVKNHYEEKLVAFNCSGNSSISISLFGAEVLCVVEVMPS